MIDKTLLLRAESSVTTRPLYQTLETVRAYAARQLESAGERDDAREGLARYCTRQASLAAEGLVGPAQVEWMHRVHDDLESYRDALTWLLERGRAAEAADIASGLMFFWWIRGHAAEGLQWYERILKLRPLSPAAESRALLGAAALWYAQGRLDRAGSALARARALPDSGGDRLTVVRTEDLSARVEWGLGNLQAARDRFAAAIDGFQALAIPWGIGNALIGLSGVALESADPDLAERLLVEATAVLRHSGPWFQSRALFVRGILAVARGNADEAIALVRESLTRIKDLQDKYAFVHALVPLAAAAALKGDDAWAARILGARDAVTERTGATVVVKPVHTLKERAEREVRARLGPERWARAYAAGRSASIDALLKDIDEARAQTGSESDSDADTDTVVPGERGVHGHADTSADRRPDRGDAQCVRQTARAALFLVQMTDERAKCAKTHCADDGAGHGAIRETVARAALRRLRNAHERVRSERPASYLDETRPDRCGRSRLERGLCTVLRGHGA